MIGARNLCLSAGPKGTFLWGLETLLPNLPPALFCLSCQISLHSLPRRFGPGQVILVSSLLLGKETPVQLSIFKCLFFPAACFPSGSLSSLTLPGLLFPACLSQTLPWVPGRALPWQGALAAPGCLSPSHTATHLLLPLCFSFLFTLCAVWSNKSCHPSPFCLQLPPAVPVQWIYLYCGTGFYIYSLFLKQSSGTMLLMYLKVLQILFDFIWEI